MERDKLYLIIVGLGLCLILEKSMENNVIG
jgi:hypothetical protein